MRCNFSLDNILKLLRKRAPQGALFLFKPIWYDAIQFDSGERNVSKNRDKAIQILSGLVLDS